MRRLLTRLPLLALLAIAAAGCRQEAPTNSVRVSGHVEADDVQLAAEVGGRILELTIAEGDRVVAGQVIARLDTRDAALAIARLRAERAQADAQLRLLLAGSRQEDIRQAAAQVTAAEADIGAVESELINAQADLDRYEALLKANAGSRKSRDDAQARRDVARDRVAAAQQRARAMSEGAARVKAGARREEVEAARARVAVVDAQIATFEKAIGDAAVTAPAAGMITSKLVNVGEIIAPRAPLAVMTDLDHAWGEVFVDEPLVPRLALGQPATLYTDAGGVGLPGKVTFISPKAEFTPRNVQTAEERSRLVYRVKVTVDNSKGVLKPGMPVEAELPLR
ncbi:MAG: HlyD family efflux transporter periplasmic adaptor subunit [Vicinamibacteria bacterium]|nr:HlyD family efflux transporter periplasmic adaptor subunit [Vicinamibacteria bacterium]